MGSLGGGPQAHLPHGALHAPQKVVIVRAHTGLAVAVVHLEPQLLHLLEVVIDREDLGKDGVQVALDHLAAINLRGMGTGQSSPRGGGTEAVVMGEEGMGHARLRDTGMRDEG